jgi:uncharacterized paraquat-inducible protein A
MALIKCHECQCEVSSEASNCPKCGAVVNAGGKFAVAIVLFILLFILRVFVLDE